MKSLTTAETTDVEATVETENGPLTFHASDLGPVEDFEFELPPEGGLVVLRGPQGAGKSLTIHNVGVLLDGKGKVSKRDGAAQGSLVGAGGRLTVKKKTMVKSSDLLIDGLSGDLPELHSPGKKTPATRDAVRITRLAELAGIPADISAFESLEGFRHCKEAAQRDEHSTQVALAASVRRDFQALARNAEDRETSASREALVRRNLISDVDFNKPSDEQALNAIYEDAVGNRAELSERRTHQVQAIEMGKRAAKEKDADEWDGPSTTECNSDIEIINQQIEDLKISRDKARAAQVSALEQDVKVAAWDMAINSIPSEDAVVTQEMIDDASQVADRARDDVIEGAAIREAEKTREEIAELDGRKFEATRSAEVYRKSAEKCGEIVNQAVNSIPNCGLQIVVTEDGENRMKVADGRFLDDLSDGERWVELVPLMVAQNRLIPLRQSAYGELQPQNRLLLHRLAKGANGWILTAQADDRPLHCLPYDELLVRDIVQVNPAATAVEISGLTQLDIERVNQLLSESTPATV